MRTRLIVVVNPIMPKSLKPNNQESRTSPRDEQSCCRCSRIFAIALANSMLASRVEKNPMRGEDNTRATESDLARGKIQMLFLREGHPSCDEDVNMEGPDGEEEPQEKSHPPEMEEPEFHPREEFNKYNCAVNLPEMADMAEGGELHVGQVDLHTNPTGSMKEYNNMLDSFGGANPSVIPQPGMRRCKGSTLGSHEHAEPRHKFSLLAVQRAHGIWIPHAPRQLILYIKMRW